MQAAAVPIVKDLVLIGGGHTHALVLRAWGMTPIAGVRLTLINPGPTAPYTGMLPGHIAGHYGRDALEIDLVRLARFAGARIILGAVTGIDPSAQRITVPGRPAIGYDIASIDIGVTSRMEALPGFAAHATPAKPLADFAEKWRGYCQADGPAKIAIIGGGVAGVELALACAHRMEQLGRRAQVTVVDQGEILGQAPVRVRRHLADVMRQKGIVTKARRRVAEVTATSVILTDGEVVETDFVIGAAGAVPHAWLTTTGLDHENGCITVDKFLRSTSHPNIYGAGDCVHLTASPRPKAGVFAVRAAPILLHNLRADLIGQPRKPFKPQKDFLKLISLGEKSALAEKSGFSFAGPAMWRWKDRIDRRFMDRLQRLPVPKAQALPANAARGVATALAGPAPCGGCGAKLPPGALKGLRDRHAGALRDDVATGIGDDAAILKVGGARQVISTDHLRAFSDDPVLVTRVAALHALGDIWAMGAEPQAAFAQIILPRVSGDLQERWLNEIMEAASDAFAAEGVQIAGGHSSMGTELTIGFTVTGLVGREPLTKAGARPGDALILTRAIGSGTILAAEMRGKARGVDVAALWDTLTQSQSDIAKWLAAEANATTDVTGFGLAGHLWEMCEASGTQAEVVLADVPIMPAAQSHFDGGMRSTLWPDNRDAIAPMVNAGDAANTGLLYDPQTSGGMLAAVPAEKALAVLAMIKNQAPDAAIIGRMTEGDPRITVK